MNEVCSVLVGADDELILRYRFGGSTYNLILW